MPKEKVIGCICSMHYHSLAGSYFRQYAFAQEYRVYLFMG